MSEHDFPVLPASGLSVDEILRYLHALRNSGYQVFKDAQREQLYHVPLTDSHTIRISRLGRDNMWQIQLWFLENISGFLDVSTLPQLERAVEGFGRKALGEWPAKPKSGRLRSDTPAQNYRTASVLIGAALVEAVFDPYLRNSSLTSLTDILSFGQGGIARGIRLLGSSKTAGGSKPDFTKRGVDAWLSQMGVTGEARVLSSKSEHRRFLLLSGGQSLLMGHSMNAFHKNEAIRVEPDAADRPFFENAWRTATPLT